MWRVCHTTFVLNQLIRRTGNDEYGRWEASPTRVDVCSGDVLGIVSMHQELLETTWCRLPGDLSQPSTRRVAAESELDGIVLVIADGTSLELLTAARDYSRGATGASLWKVFPIPLLCEPTPPPI
jgi:hypothetical protein